MWQRISGSQSGQYGNGWIASVRRVTKDCWTGRRGRTDHLAGPPVRHTGTASKESHHFVCRIPAGSSRCSHKVLPVVPLLQRFDLVSVSSVLPSRPSCYFTTKLPSCTDGLL